MAKRIETDVARLYHLHSSYERARGVEPSLDPHALPARFRTYPGAARTPLPGRDFAIGMTLGQALAERRSVRDYTLAPLPLETLGRLLFACHGAREQRAGGEWVFQRSAPSAGGKYPNEIYIATQSVEGLADGIYHYDARAHALEHRRPGLAHPALLDLTLGQEMIRDANVVLAITGVRERTMWKYGQRGYRFVLLDAGHLGQNVYLTATALGLGPCGLGGFYDAEVNALLELPRDEETLYLIALGQPARHEKEERA
jgi:SagB-type dehydrogenase family enzyme